MRGRAWGALAVASAILAAGSYAAAAGAASAADKSTMFWVRSDVPLDATDEKVVTVEKLPGKVKLGSACGSPGSTDHWTAATADSTGRRPVQLVEVVGAGVSKHGSVISSIRVEGECKQANGTKWVKYSGVVDRTRPAAAAPAGTAQPATAATPKPAPKKGDAKKPK